MGRCFLFLAIWVITRRLSLSSQKIPVWFMDISANQNKMGCTLVKDYSESECIPPLLALINVNILSCPILLQENNRHNENPNPNPKIKIQPQSPQTSSTVPVPRILDFTSLRIFQFNCQIQIAPIITQNLTKSFYDEQNDIKSLELIIKIKLQMKSNQHRQSQGIDKIVYSIDTKKSNLKNANKPKTSLNDAQSAKILEQVEKLLANNENLQAINLLRALKDNMQAVKNVNLVVLTIVNLAILYYQVGFLEEANQEFAIALAKLKELTQKMAGVRTKDVLRMKYQTMMGKIELQICILYSQMGKHDLGLEHANISSKINYNIIYEILSKLHANLNKLLISKNHPKKEGHYIEFDDGKNTLNCIAVLNHLISNTKDLKLAFLQKERSTLLEQQSQITRKFGIVSPKVDIQMLYSIDENDEHMWIYKNKILDQIQLVPFEIDYFDDPQQEISKNEVIEKIAFLAISLYCYSTETRFLEKQKNCDSHDVLDSEHWLSRSLEIAYSFMPSEAPILNQILTVHDRFHGLDKQTIPQDEEVTGFFKVLKPLSKPKSTYSSKNPGCSPIMIRIQADKVDLQAEPSVKTHRELPISRNIIELDQTQRTIDLSSFGKNNKIRGFSHAHKRVETDEVQTQRLSHRTIDNPLSVNCNIRSNYVSKKFGRNKDDKLKINFSDLHGKALISEDLLSRPQSLTKKEEKEESVRSASERRKKSLPFRKNEPMKRPQTLGNAIKYAGLQLKGQRMQQAIETDLFQRLNDTKMLESARIGGNVYINNNINLYISKNAEMNPFGQTYIRGQVLHDKVREEKDMSRRQIFLNKRRANNFIGEEIQ